MKLKKKKIRLLRFMKSNTKMQNRYGQFERIDD